MWPGTAQAFDPGTTPSDQPLALEAVASYLPFSGSDVRLGAGVAFQPLNPAYFRIDLVEHCAGLSLNHRFTVLDALQLSAGVSAYYEFTTGRVRPAVTLARILF